jgi:exoribonuclease-2
MSETDASAQVELDSGKRVKVKAANMLIKFEKPSPGRVHGHRAGASQDIELEMAWEFAPDEEFGFADLARDYFSSQAHAVRAGGHAVSAVRVAPLLPPRRQGALSQGVRRCDRPGAGRHREEESWWPADHPVGHELGAGQCPEPVREQLYKILFKPDKNAPEYKAVVEAARATHTAPLELLQKSGAIDSPYLFHWKRFLLENFPKGTGFPALAAPAIDDALPWHRCTGLFHRRLADHRDRRRLSVQGLGSGTITLGIHIAAPGLAIQPGDAVDQTGAQPPVHGLHAGLQGHHAARCTGADLHPASRARLPGAVAVRDAGRGDAGDQGHESRIERVRIAAQPAP